MREHEGGVRYADDALMAFDNVVDAERVLSVLGKRLARYGLRGRQQSTDRPEQHNTRIRLVFPTRADSVKSFRALTSIPIRRASSTSAQRGYRVRDIRTRMGPPSTSLA